MTWCMSLICIKNLLEKSNCSVTVTFGNVHMLEQVEYFPMGNHFTIP